MRKCVARSQVVNARVFARVSHARELVVGECKWARVWELVVGAAPCHRCILVCCTASCCAMLCVVVFCSVVFVLCCVVLCLCWFVLCLSYQLWRLVTKVDKHLGHHHPYASLSLPLADPLRHLHARATAAASAITTSAACCNL